MDLLYLGILFVFLLVLMSRGLGLYYAMMASSLLGFLLYRISPGGIGQILLRGTFSLTTIELVLAFYTITFLQRMMEEKDHLKLAESSLTRLFGSRRINATLAPFVIGLLPSAGAVLIARPIVDNAAEGYLDVEERCFVTTYFRHISEIFLPTYATIILAMALSGVDMLAFVLAMLPLVFVLFFLGYIFYVRKIPRSIAPKGVDKKKELKNLFVSLWSIGLSIILILSFKLPVYLAVIPVVVLSLFINKFTWQEIRPMFLSAFEYKLILTTVTIMIFKELLVFTGVIDSLPQAFSSLPLPPILIFGLIFFVGTLLAGSQAMIAMMLPLAVASLGSSLGLIIFIMSTVYIASQISPTHICLGIVTEAYDIPFTALVKKTLLIVLAFMVISSLYSYGLFILF